MLECVMRKFLIPFLMASTMLPAAAQARDESMLGAVRERAARASDERNSSDERSQRVERSPRGERSERPVRVERAERPDRSMRIERAERTQHQPRLEQQAQQAQTVEQVRRERRTDSGMVDGFRRIARDAETRQVETQRDRNRDGFDGLRDRIVRDGTRVNRDRWSDDWRRDHRYDWRKHRDRHRSLFRIGRYYDPYGWNYRRFSIGFSLYPSYYSSNYWLDDPWMYRLPPAYGPYRWVRYYDDALLVNIYTGQVVDVLYSFFW